MKKFIHLNIPTCSKRQLAFAARVVKELRGFDNVYFEVCNEPYFGGVTGEWQDKVIEAIVAAERGKKNKHLIAQNIANAKAKIEKPNPATSIFNFHYATPPETVALNWKFERPIGDDETGFKGTGNRVYRTEAWEFLLAGGSIFSNLDYSFTVGSEDGSAKVNDPTPGGGGAAFREQIGVLKSFLESFDLLALQPAEGAKVLRGAPEGVRPYMLADESRACAVYVREGSRVTLGLPLTNGKYRYEWIDPTNGKTLSSGTFYAKASGSLTELTSPEHSEDVALRVLLEPKVE